MPAPSYRNFCFTLHDTEAYRFEEHGLLDPVGENWPDFRYCVYQLEQGDTPADDKSGIHYQGYIEFTTKKTYTAIKRFTHPSIHLEPRKGTQQQAITYCTKEESRLDGPWEFGERARGGSQSTRTDWETLKRRLDDGASIEDIAESHFSLFLRYERGIRSYKRLKQPEYNDKPEVIVYYGPGHTGKSHRARIEAGNDYYLLRRPNVRGGALWWNGYAQQEVVLVDEFYGWMLLDEFLVLTEEGIGRTVQTKGGHEKFASKKIIFTSNKHPFDWYKQDTITDWGSYVRRFTDICFVPFRRNMADMMEEKGLHRPPPSAIVSDDWTPLNEAKPSRRHPYSTDLWWEPPRPVQVVQIANNPRPPLYDPPGYSIREYPYRPNLTEPESGISYE